MNMARAREWEMLQGVRLLRQSNETILGPLHDAINPLEVNAYYAHLKNAICKYNTFFFIMRVSFLNKSRRAGWYFAKAVLLPWLGVSHYPNSPSNFADNLFIER